MHVWAYMNLLQESEEQLADAFAALAEYHGDELDIHATARLLATWSRQHVVALTVHGERYRPPQEPKPELAPQIPFLGPRSGRHGLLHDLQGAWLLGQQVHLRWTVLGQTARVLRDRELAALCADLGRQTYRQLNWLHTRIVDAAPQALIIEPDSGTTGEHR